MLYFKLDRLKGAKIPTKAQGSDNNDMDRQS